MLNYFVREEDMETWEIICKEYAKRVGAELLFVNSESFGIMYSDGSLRHIYIDELKEELSSKIE